MSYGVYSEVYFAVSACDDVNIKIGETTNARRRGSQLAKDDYLIMRSRDVAGGEAERLFVESFLRARINASGKATQIRKDYFLCDTKDTAVQFLNLFNNWVDEANAILKQMKSGIAITFREAYKTGRPEFPTGKEWLYNAILEDCDKYGHWYDKRQCGATEADIILTELRKVLCPYGYECTMQTNYSWKTFRVKKNIF